MSQQIRRIERDARKVFFSGKSTSSLDECHAIDIPRRYARWFPIPIQDRYYLYHDINMLSAFQSVLWGIRGIERTGAGRGRRHERGGGRDGIIQWGRRRSTM